MFFLLQRMNQLRDLAQPDLFDTRIVSDFLLDKDPIFARLTLSDDELALYQQLYDHLRPQAPLPDLVIYLQAEPQTLIDRIRKRGIPMEAGISENYMHRLCESYSRILIVNTEHLNPIDNDEDFALLLTRIANMRGKREFFSRGE